MIFAFIDAENLSTDTLSKIKYSLRQKVVVFSKSERVRLLCERNLWSLISMYEIGKNKADLRLIATLSRALHQDYVITAPLKHRFILHSNDEALISAFTEECELAGVRYRVEKESKETPASKLQNLPNSPRRIKASELKVSAPINITMPTQSHTAKTKTSNVQCSGTNREVQLEKLILERLSTPRKLNNKLARELEISPADLTTQTKRLINSGSIVLYPKQEQHWVDAGSITLTRLQNK